MQRNAFGWRYSPTPLLVGTLTFALLVSGSMPAHAGEDRESKFTNRNGVANTRHNLTQRPFETGSGGAIDSSEMDRSRNDYDQICVYCHTPHGASGVVDAPLWNRTRTNATFTTYASLGSTTITQNITTPGVNSLTCLSCHDGTVAIDSIINMPNNSPFGGPSDNYNAAQETSVNTTFLDSWDNPGSSQGNVVHVGLGSPTDPTGSQVGCMVCHSSVGSGTIFADATDFTAMVIGTDLSNDHPVGIQYPTAGAGVDFNALTGTVAGISFFDGNGNGRPDTDEVRVYDTGEGPEVECASCHDPHGVPTGGAGSTHARTFLRVENTASALCLTCHEK